jgi:phage repressor protein C with HTH and peptisase S24 domain
MPKLNDVIERIKDIISEDFAGKKVFDKDVAEALGIPQMRFATMKSRNKIPFQEILDFCATRSIAANWLLYDQSPESLVDSTNRYYQIKYFHDVSASAGGGAENNFEFNETLELEAKFLQVLSMEQESKYLEALNVTGDSMEPTFYAGDIIFINRNRCNIDRGGVFTIRTEYGDLFIKRLHKRIDGNYDIISDNKDYPVQTARPEELTVIGEVIGKFGTVE